MRKGGQRKASGKVPPSEPLKEVTRVQASAPAPVGVLIGKDGPLEGKTFEISKEGLKIGRDPARCDIVIDNPHVSREHAWIGEENGKVVVKDLTSANGTFLNTLSHQIQSEILTPGDIIIIGKGKMASFLFKPSS
jgi:pSer/pThr/pTyr-binding forkhead associated (FHA) protein